MPGDPKPIAIYVDADACQVKAEVYRVAERHRLKVYVVANSFIAVPRQPFIERVVVGGGFDAADDWIAERVSRGDIVVTADVPLASRCVKAGAIASAPALTQRLASGTSAVTTMSPRETRSAIQSSAASKPPPTTTRSMKGCRGTAIKLFATT